MTTVQKLAAGIAGTAVIYVGLSHFGLLPAALTVASVVPQKFDLQTDAAPQAPVSSDAVQAVPLPSTTPSTKVRGPVLNVKVIPWNAEMGHHFAVGGPVTTVGSLMEKYGVAVSVVNQPDDTKALEDLLKMASEMAAGNDEPTTGTQFVIDMGDAMGQYLADGNKKLAKLGPDYRLEIIGAVGYSRGEDKCMGQPEWKDNPQAMKGALIAAQLRQGDWNLCQYFEGQNGLKNNPDETTWDADAVNWYSTDDFEKAAQAYIGNAEIDLDEVKDGHKTGKRVKKHVNGVATWTPQDVEIAKKRGGLVSLLSTKENAYQMPATIIGLRKWDIAHTKLVTNYLKAALEGGEQVRAFDAALQRAGKASWAIYKDQSPSYWVTYYKGVTVSDKVTKLPLSLGGSSVMTLDDNLCLFGLADGCGNLGSSMYNASYTGFATLVQKQYPRILPSFPKIEDAVNTTYLSALAAARPSKDAKSADLVAFDEVGGTSDKVAKRDWNIQFDSGQASFTPAAQATLEQLYNALLIGGALTVEIDGHTDNTGNPALSKAQNQEQNQDLSKRRAAAVEVWMKEKAPKFFATGRVVVHGFGDTMPAKSNDTPDGRAANRRVTIILGSKS